MTSADTLAAFGAASAVLRELAIALRKRPDVSEVLDRVDLQEDPPAVEWYVDAELHDGEALSWRLLAYWRENAWTIEADISRVQSQGSHAVLETAARRVDDKGLRDALMAATGDLLRHVTFSVAD